MKPRPIDDVSAAEIRQQVGAGEADPTRLRRPLLRLLDDRAELRERIDSLYREDPERWVVVDGVGTPDEVGERACAVLRARGLLEARGIR